MKYKISKQRLKELILKIIGPVSKSHERLPKYRYVHFFDKFGNVILEIDPETYSATFSRDLMKKIKQLVPVTDKVFQEVVLDIANDFMFPKRKS